MLTAKISRSSLKGDYFAIPSKSFVHRALICASLSKSESVVKGISLSNDITATVGALNSLGADIRLEGDCAYVKPINSPKNCKVDCLESGSTLRFILPLISFLGVECEVVGSQRLAQRPIVELISCLEKAGVKFENKSLPLKLSGGVQKYKFAINGEKSSQYITGLLLASPYLKKDIVIEVLGRQTSVGYIDITLQIMREFGVIVQKTHNGYYIKAGQSYSLSNGEYKIEGDYSNASYFMLAGVFDGNINIHNLKEDSTQGDRKVVDILKQMGAKISFEAGVLKCERSALWGVEVDGTDIPDMIPTIAIACAFANGESKITGVDRLKDKECDRLQAIIDILDILCVDYEYHTNCLKIWGGFQPCDNYHFVSQNDHRIAMISAVVGALVGNTNIVDFGAINKSYPNFTEDFSKLGGLISVE